MMRFALLLILIIAITFGVVLLAAWFAPPEPDEKPTHDQWEPYE